MRRQVTSAVERWPLAAPFRISRGVKTVAEVVVVGIAAGGAVGRGEGVPYARYGESAETVMAQIAAVADAVAAGADRAALAMLLEPGAARNAIDCALWDLEARLAGAPAPAPPTALVTALTVGLDTPERMGAAARALGPVPLVKVKVDAGKPEACLRSVREHHTFGALIVDPNESWDIALLQRMQPVLRELEVAFVEQPLPAGEDAALERLAALVPNCADESCHTADDVPRLIGRYGMANIKLDKAGGLTEAWRLYHAARDAGLGVMVGCMICTSLSIAPALRLAAEADFADLDGPLWLTADRPGGVTGRDGRLTAPAAGFWGG